MTTGTNDNIDGGVGAGSAVAEMTCEEALERMRPELMAMREEEIERDPKLDPVVAANIAEGGVRKAAVFEDELVAVFGAPAKAALAKLLIVAFAAKQADFEHASAAGTADVAALHAEMMKVHGLIMNAAEGLVRRGLIGESELAPARDIAGYHTAYRSMMVVIALLTRVWPQVEAYTGLKKEDLELGRGIAQRFSSELVAREQGVTRAPTGEVRVRATSKLIREYDQLRRQMTYVRWEQDDVDRITPSLWSGRRNRMRTEAPVVTDGPSTPGGIVVAPTPAPAPTPGSDGPGVTPAVGPLDPTEPGGPFAS